MDIFYEFIVRGDIGNGDSREHFLEGHFEGAVELFLGELLVGFFDGMNAVFGEQVGMNPKREFDLRMGQINEIGTSNVEISIFL